MSDYRVMASYDGQITAFDMFAVSSYERAYELALHEIAKEFNMTHMLTSELAANPVNGLEDFECYLDAFRMDELTS